MIDFILVAVLAAAAALLLALRSSEESRLSHSGLGHSQDGQSEPINSLVPVRTNQPKLVEIGEVPDVFSEERLKRDLEMLSDTPSLYYQYVHRARTRLKKKGEVKILDHWTQFFESGAKLVKAKTDLGRARSDYQQLSYENEIGLKKKDLELARLDAEHEEQIARKE